MATASQVKTGLDEISSLLVAQREVMRKAKSNSSNASAALDGIAAAYADVVATINGYANDSSDYFERTAKAELAKLTAEFIALKGISDAVSAIDV